MARTGSNGRRSHQPATAAATTTPWLRPLPPASVPSSRPLALTGNNPPEPFQCLEPPLEGAPLTDAPTWPRSNDYISPGHEVPFGWSWLEGDIPGLGRTLVHVDNEGVRRAGRIDDDLFHLLLAALIEAADRVANTTGVYASFVKSWQPNARRRLRLRAPEIVRGNGCHAHRKDALDLVADLEPFDLLYLDPPYNNRQYPAYYHVPEIIAEGWFDGGMELRGKTGLAPDEDKRSDWSRTGKCEAAFERLVATAPWTHVVMSYNDEGIIPEATIERVLKENGRKDTYRRYSRSYKRYRSDADGEDRKYKGDRVEEYLYCVSR